jgi:hypothetical protein
MRWPSAKSVSNARDDLPDPERPVTTTNLFRGMATLRLLRLLTRAFLMMMYDLGSRSSMSIFSDLVLKVIAGKVTNAKLILSWNLNSL